MTAESTGREPLTGAPEGAGADDGFWDAIPEKPSDEELVRLRNLLFRHEIALVERLRELQDNQRYNARKVSESLPEAIQLRTGKDQLMEHSLAPVVDDIVRTLLRKRRGDFVEALFPLMGPSIRKSMAESFRSMLGSFSKSMEMAFSWKGLRWRLEAIRSGKPFSEIVMLNTLVYRVEQIFFIHSQTGIPLVHLAFDEEQGKDADMVSSMFTAIQDFVRDCFAGGDSEGELESLQLGDHTIVVEKGAQAYLACVVRGTPPASFREQLRTTLDSLLLEYAEPLSGFSGDTEPFAGAVHYLDDCLTSHFADDDKKIPWWGKAMPVFLVAALVGAVGLYQYRQVLEDRERQAVERERQAYESKLEEALNALRAAPGLLVINVAAGQGTPREATVLKDALAEAPEDALRRQGYDPDMFAFKVVPFISYDPSIVVRRVQRTISLPDTVSMSFDKGTLSFSGVASLGWIVGARDQARALPGVERVDVSGLRDPAMDRISELIAQVEATVVEFALGKDTPVPEDAPKLQKAVDSLVELENIVKKMGFTVSLVIYGHADATGTDKRNYEISQARTRTVAAMLYGRGSSMSVAMYGMGASYPKDGQKEGQAEQAPKHAGADARGDQSSRRVELRVHVLRSAAADPGILLSQP
ncbi:MAG: OmpA family protein [Desulfovibrio sp.]|jgi:OOP family OmpA-OmpF porin|nr:OmpA family protein [Desulfovibrio sp.]